MSYLLCICEKHITIHVPGYLTEGNTRLRVSQTDQHEVRRHRKNKKIYIYIYIYVYLFMCVYYVYVYTYTFVYLVGVPLLA